MNKNKKFDKIKALKRISRRENKVTGKSGAGVHVDKKDKRIKKKSTNDYLDELEEEEDENG